MNYPGTKLGYENVDWSAAWAIVCHNILYWRNQRFHVPTYVILKIVSMLLKRMSKSTTNINMENKVKRTKTINIQIK